MSDSEINTEVLNHAMDCDDETIEIEQEANTFPDISTISNAQALKMVDGCIAWLQQ